MKKALKPTIIIVMVFVFCGIGWLAWKWIATEKLLGAYVEIKKGDSEMLVLKALGTPSKISGPPENISWDSDNTLRPNKGECAQEFWYVPPISIAGEEFTIGFDAHSNVVSKYRYESP